MTSRRVEVVSERRIPQPIETVFARYTDHAGWTAWAGLGRVELVQEGKSERDGEGAVRAFALAPGLREAITRFEPPTLMRYSVIAGGYPLDDHEGEVRFEPDGSGTRVIWRVAFRSRLPGTLGLLRAGLAWLFPRLLRRFEQHLQG